MIQAHTISKAYGGKVLLENVSFTINEGDKVGLIGPNGTGKSSLFQIILEKVEADKGNITLVHEQIGYLPQQLDYREDETIHAHLKPLVPEWEEYKIDIALARVDIQLDKNTLLSSLSGGEKTKIGIARLLVTDPTMLLLDEPTNNLDLESMAWLEQFVKNFDGTIFTISHDRTFLDNTVQKIFELDSYSHTLNEFHGGYSYYIAEKERRFEKDLATFRDYAERKKEMEEWINNKQQQLRLHRNPKVARQLQAMKTRYEREFLENLVEKPRLEKRISLSSIGDEIHKKRVIFYIEDMKFKLSCHPDESGHFVKSKYESLSKARYDSDPLRQEIPDRVGNDTFLTCHKLTITGGDRIALQGKNGAGKTTFIKILLNVIKDYEGLVERGKDIKVGYFSQEHATLDLKKTVIEEFMAKTKIGDEQVSRKILGQFHFKERHVFTRVSALSQGEKVKLIIAQLTHQENQFLILDEPTNHLDIQSREVLEQALKDYQGGFIIISHDRYFMREIGVNKKIKIERSSDYLKG